MGGYILSFGVSLQSLFVRRIRVSCMDQVSRRRVLGALGGSLAVSTAGCAYSDTGAQSASEQPTVEVDTPDVETDYTDLIEETIGSVALIQVPAAQSQGSAFVYDEQHLITNEHVVQQATDVELLFTDNEWTDGTVVGTDRRSDLAVVRADELPSYATPLPLADSPPVVGEDVIAVGNPLGFSDSVSAGIISGTQRSIPLEDVSLPNAVQTDAALNSGNSGGPLLRTNGAVVAVVSLGAGEGLGFGVSARLVERVVPELIQTGDFEHPFLGVTFQDVTPQVADLNDLTDAAGVMVVETVPTGPAADAFQEATETQTVGEVPIPIGGDVLRRVDDTEIAISDDLARYLTLETAPGDTVEIEFLRDNDLQTAAVTLASRRAFE